MKTTKIIPLVPCTLSLVLTLRQVVYFCQDAAGSIPFLGPSLELICQNSFSFRRFKWSRFFTWCRYILACWIRCSFSFFCPSAQNASLIGTEAADGWMLLLRGITHVGCWGCCGRGGVLLSNDRWSDSLREPTTFPRICIRHCIFFVGLLHLDNRLRNDWDAVATNGLWCQSSGFSLS